MARSNTYPSGIRKRGEGNWEYRHTWNTRELAKVHERFGAKLSHLPASFWKPGQKVEAYAPTIRDIKRAREVIRAQISLGQYVPRRVEVELAKLEQAQKEAEAKADSVLFKDVAEEFFTFLTDHGVRYGSVRTYRSHFNQAMEPLHDEPIVSITADDLEAWFEEIRDRKGDGYAYRVYRTVKMIFAYALGHDRRQHRTFKPYITVDPCTLYAGKKPEVEKKYALLTAKQVTALASHMPPHRAIAVWLGAVGGLRFSEVLGLQRQHVEVRDGIAWVKVEQQLVRATKGPAHLASPKTKAGHRFIALPSWEGMDPAPLIELWLKTHVADSPHAHVVPLRSGHPAGVSHTQLGKNFKDARERAEADGVNMQGATFHDLRHTALTNYGKQPGVGLGDLMAFSGHTEAKAVSIYQQSSELAMERIARASKQ